MKTLKITFVALFSAVLLASCETAEVNPYTGYDTLEVVDHSNVTITDEVSEHLSPLDTPSPNPQKEPNPVPHTTTENKNGGISEVD